MHVAVCYRIFLLLQQLCCAIADGELAYHQAVKCSQ